MPRAPGDDVAGCRDDTKCLCRRVLPLGTQAANRRAAFETVYRDLLWVRPPSASGPGSSTSSAGDFWLTEAKSQLDAGCWDLFWLSPEDRPPLRHAHRGRTSDGGRI